MKNVFASIVGIICVASLALFFQGCDGAPQAQSTGAVAPLDSVQSLDVYVENSTINLLLAGPVGKRTAVRYLKSTDGGKSWSKPVAVPIGDEPPGLIRRGNDAQIAASGQHLIATWPSEGGKLDWIGPMASALSDDGGKTWHPGPDPAGSGYQKGQAFIDMTATARGVFHVVWIDASTGQEGLHAARSSDGGAHWSAARTLDPATCQCCWTALGTGSHDHLYALYRNINPRDMGLAVSTDDGESWRQTGPVGNFHWDFKACPHTGGGLAVTGGASHTVLHAVVWTGKKGRVGLHYLVSGDGGHDWKLAQRLGGKGTRHADIAALGGQRIAVVWDAATSEGHSSVFISESGDGGSTWSQPRRLSSQGAEATHPRIVTVDGHYCVFWTQSDGEWKMLHLG